MQRHAEETLKWWKPLPSPFQEEGARVESVWWSEFTKSNEEFVEACVSTCNDVAATEEIECRRRAETIVAWKQCLKR